MGNRCCKLFKIAASAPHYAPSIDRLNVSWRNHTKILTEVRGCDRQDRLLPYMAIRVNAALKPDLAHFELEPCYRLYLADSQFRRWSNFSTPWSSTTKKISQSQVWEKFASTWRMKTLMRRLLERNLLQLPDSAHGSLTSSSGGLNVVYLSCRAQLMTSSVTIKSILAI